MIGLEPTTYALPRRCATDCATSASTVNIILQFWRKVKRVNNIFYVNKFSWKNFRFFWKKGLTNHFLSAIILKQSGIPIAKMKMRVCWNWQTGTFEGRVSTDVWVQVPLLAPIKRLPNGKRFFVYDNNYIHKSSPDLLNENREIFIFQGWYRHFPVSFWYILISSATHSLSVMISKLFSQWLLSQDYLQWHQVIKKHRYISSFSL